MAASPTPTNAHSPTETLTASDAIPTKGQPSDSTFAADATANGEKRKREADQAEENHELSSSHPLSKTSLCSFFRRQSGSCSHGAACRYAHGEDELRPRPDNSWDPTSERAKKLAKKSDVDGDECGANEDVMMTEDVVADEDGDGGGSDPGLSKCLVHLPRKWRSDDLNRFLSEQGIACKSAKKKKGMTVGFVSFESVEQLKGALEELEGKSFGNKGIKVADVKPRSFEKKNKPTMAIPPNAEKTDKIAISGDVVDVSVSSNGTLDVDANEENSTLNGSASSGKSARDVVTPLAHMPYSEQLEHKKSSLMQILKRLTRNARKACPNGVSLPEWVLKSREIGGLPCNFEGILASPLVNGYRNKCEFSVGYSLQGKITVGFMLGNFREGVTAVEEPVDCPNVSTIACKYASIFQEFLQDSGFPVWNRFKNTGFWRQLTVREGRRPEKVADSANSETNTAEIMLMVQVSTMGFDDVLVTSEFERLAQAFAAGAAASSPSLPLTALVVQDHQGISNVAPADAPLRSLTIPKVEISPETETNILSEARIHDYISNLTFSISPTAFFQVNTLAAEKLYALAGDWAGLGPDTLLFDVCCGTGTIGLTLAHRVGMVVGIEMNASAVLDAQRNAEINGIKNCRFVCSKAEDVMGSLLKEYLNASQKQDESQNISESGDKVSSTAEEKDISTDNVQDPKGSLCHSAENVAECGESSSHEVEKVKTGSDSLEDGKPEPDSQVESNCTSENGNPSVQCFKNVVAIVDPPRGGLHPTVSNTPAVFGSLLVSPSCNAPFLSHSSNCNAQRNAEINGIKNCRFVCSKAEDVMGSLLKEYLNASQKQDESQNISESGDKVSSTAEEKDISTDNVQDPKGSLCHSAENVAECGESSSHEVEKVKTGSDSLEDGKLEPDSQVESNCTSENGNPSVQCFKNVVAIVDPPRGGLHPTVIKALRTHPLLRRLVYISCNPESLVANAIELCTPSAEKNEKGNKNNRGWRNMSAAGLARHRAKSMPVSEPFQPVKSMAVDLFPHTAHCEMVMLLER